MGGKKGRIIVREGLWWVEWEGCGREMGRFCVGKRGRFKNGERGGL